MFGLLIGAAVALTTIGGTAMEDFSSPVDTQATREHVAMRADLPLYHCELEPNVMRLSEPGESQSRSGRIERTEVPASNMADWCGGFVGRSPSLCFEATEDAQYRFEVVASGDVDSILVVREPGTNRVYCDDDSAGELRPEILTGLVAGVYEVYVGSYNAGASGDFSLRIERMTGDAPR